MSYTKIMTGMNGFTAVTAGTCFGCAIELGMDLNGDSHPDMIAGTQVRGDRLCLHVVVHAVGSCTLMFSLCRPYFCS
jgi:hypothetical protein